MTNIFRITLAAAAICAVPMATIAIAADHREAPMIQVEPATDADGRKTRIQTTPEHETIDTWRKTRVLIRRPPVVRPPVDY